MLREEAQQQRVRALGEAGGVARRLARRRRRALDGQRGLDELEQLPQQQRPQIGGGHSRGEGRQRLQQVVHRELQRRRQPRHCGGRPAGVRVGRRGELGGELQQPQHIGLLEALARAAVDLVRGEG